VLKINTLLYLSFIGFDMYQYVFKWDRLHKVLPCLTSLNTIYDRASITDKHSLIKAVFKHAITFSDSAFRTSFISEVFAHNYLNIKEKWLLLLEQPVVFSGANPFCSP
jgi:hypothetical protein